MHQSTKPVLISSGLLSALIDPFGAELISLRDSLGREYMTDADPAFWIGYAPLLFPIVGRLNGDILRVDGRIYTMPQHGFARRLRWETIDQEASAVTFRLSDSDTTREQYPFAFSIRTVYRLEAARLTVRVTVTNTGTRPLPFSFGFHPAFAWPLPDGGDKDTHCIEFERDEGPSILRLDANGLLGNTEATPLQTRSLPLSAALFDSGVMIWDDLKSRRLSYRSAIGPWLEIHYGLPYLGVWQKPGANFICIEPWAGLADTPDYAGEFADRCAVQILAPGNEAEFAMDVIVRQR